ncbi:MAG: ABC transporter permease subunit [candidate division Zixibacteria bacterium]|nr:ABC transporter permease subunit [candidate division Zixibacteria bacterium]
MKKSGIILLTGYLFVVLIGFIWPIVTQSDNHGRLVLPTAQQKAPSLPHPLGLDDLGRDVLGNVLSGFKTSFISGLLATILFVLVGIPLGIIIGFEDRIGANIAGAITNGLNSVPIFFALFLVFIIMGTYRPFALMAMLGILCAPKLAEVLRFKITQYRKEDYYDAAIALGLSRSAVILKHILWYNSRKSIFSLMAYMFGYAVLSEATLSFILHGSMGADWQSWGDIINQGLMSFSTLAYSIFAKGAEVSLAANNPLKFLAPLFALIVTVMLFTILSRQLSEEV